MGGYGEHTTQSGVVPADAYYTDLMVLGLKSGLLKQVGSMWKEGERVCMGPLAVVEGSDGKAECVFILDRNEILRYDFACNKCGLKQTNLMKKIADNSCKFLALKADLYVLTSPVNDGVWRQGRRLPTLEVQVYTPNSYQWRTFTASSISLDLDLTTVDFIHV